MGYQTFTPDVTADNEATLLYKAKRVYSSEQNKTHAIRIVARYNPSTEMYEAECYPYGHPLPQEFHSGHATLIALHNGRKWVTKGTVSEN